MAKQILVYFALLALAVVFLLPIQTSAASWCDGSPNASCCDESTGGSNGLVPCGKQSFKRSDNMCIVNVTGGGVTRGNIVSCDTFACTLDANNCSQYVAPKCRCELYHVFFLGLNVYTFVIWVMAIPLAGIMLGIGGIMLLIGGSYPKLHDMGRTIIWGAVWGVALILGAWVIINFVLMVVGYNAPWFDFGSTFFL